MEKISNFLQGKEIETGILSSGWTAGFYIGGLIFHGWGFEGIHILVVPVLFLVCQVAVQNALIVLSGMDDYRGALAKLDCFV